MVAIFGDRSISFEQTWSMAAIFDKTSLEQVLLTFNLVVQEKDVIYKVYLSIYICIFFMFVTAVIFDDRPTSFEQTW